MVEDRHSMQSVESSTSSAGSGQQQVVLRQRTAETNGNARMVSCEKLGENAF